MNFGPAASKTGRPLTMMLVGAALITIAGCSNWRSVRPDIDALPGLSEVRPIGPKGQKCYEFCAQSEVSCKYMCPDYEGECQQDCIRDTKSCLFDCPELQRPMPKPKE